VAEFVVDGFEILRIGLDAHFDAKVVATSDVPCACVAATSRSFGLRNMGVPESFREDQANRVRTIRRSTILIRRNSPFLMSLLRPLWARLHKVSRCRYGTIPATCCQEVSE
jgi:hypothetical protein